MYHKPDRNDLCWCNSGKTYKSCHYEIEKRMKIYERKGHIVPGRALIKTNEQIEGIRESGKINTAILDYVSERIQSGRSTQEINQMVYDRTLSYGAIPAPLGYRGFPKSVCTSINQEVCHGIPSEYIIMQEGDILNVDVSTIYQGFYSDASRMYLLGEVSPERKRLVETAKEAVEVGLSQVEPWNFLGDMGQAINDFAISQGYSVVREVGGHGVGLLIHEEPFVSYVTRRGTEMLMVPGMVFTIEPMINMGSNEIRLDADNGWTIYTKDGKDSAQWEVTVLITDNGHEILAY